MKKKEKENLLIGDSGVIEKTDNLSKGVIVVCTIMIGILCYLGVMLYVG